jgi:hypothetical protein
VRICGTITRSRTGDLRSGWDATSRTGRKEAVHARRDCCGSPNSRSASSLRGIERIVDMLVRGLVDCGDDLALSAHVNSDVPCHHLPYQNTNPRHPRNMLLSKWSGVLRRLETAIGCG